MVSHPLIMVDVKVYYSHKEWKKEERVISRKKKKRKVETPALKNPIW